MSNVHAVNTHTHTVFYTNTYIYYICTYILTFIKVCKSILFSYRADGLATQTDYTTPAHKPVAVSK